VIEKGEGVRRARVRELFNEHSSRSKKRAKAPRGIADLTN